MQFDVINRFSKLGRCGTKFRKVDFHLKIFLQNRFLLVFPKSEVKQENNDVSWQYLNNKTKKIFLFKKANHDYN